MGSREIGIANLVKAREVKRNKGQKKSIMQPGWNRKLIELLICRFGGLEEVAMAMPEELAFKKINAHSELLDKREMGMSESQTCQVLNVIPNDVRQMLDGMKATGIAPPQQHIAPLEKKPIYRDCDFDVLNENISNNIKTDGS